MAPAPLLLLLLFTLSPRAGLGESQPQEEAFVRAPDPDRVEGLLTEEGVTPEILERGAALYAEGSCVFCHHRQVGGPRVARRSTTASGSTATGAFLQSAA